jgi:3-hydroxybutyryl-CoA dehydrogenase
MTERTRNESSGLPREAVVAVIGCGTMGAGIAQLAVMAGHTVKIFDSQAAAIPKAIQGVRDSLKKLADKGRLPADVAEKAATRLHAADGLKDLAGAALVVEAIVEDLEVKQRVFAELEGAVGAECILATNTSSLSITAIASALKNPKRFVGMHFFNPAVLMELVEVIGGVESDSARLATVHATAKAWGKSPVYVKSTPGFIVNRVARPFYGEALLVLAEGAASPATIDAVMREAAGFRMGPFELMDLIGLDVNFAVTQSVFNSCFGDVRYRPSLIQQEMVRARLLGRKTKRGFYEYSEQAVAAQPQSEAQAPKPASVTLPHGNALADALADRLSGTDIKVEARRSGDGTTWIEVGGCVLAITDGRSATQRAAENGRRDVVLVDLALDYKKATRLAVTKASGCESGAYSAAVGLLQAAGYAVSHMKDVPGIAAMRTVAMIANEAADLVNQDIATIRDVDTAMRKGVNYPKGPLEWADEIGVKTVNNVLRNLAAHYGGDSYRVSPLIQQLVWNDGKFH